MEDRNQEAGKGKEEKREEMLRMEGKQWGSRDKRNQRDRGKSHSMRQAQPGGTTAARQPDTVKLLHLTVAVNVIVVP